MLDLCHESGAGQGGRSKRREMFRKIYDGLFEQMNDVRIRNGYEPINYRQGYFPHFQPGTTDGILGLMGKALGIDAEVSADDHQRPDAHFQAWYRLLRECAGANRI